MDVTLKHISDATLRHYSENAEDFWLGTKDHDVTQNYQALLVGIGSKSTPLTLLDLGCGPGRDLMAFKAMGHEAVGLDGCAEFCDMARRRSHCEVLHQDFLDLNLPAERFDGIFANATLFHVPKADFPRVLGNLWSALKPGGILFTSNPRGSGEGFSGSRYASYYEWEDYSDILENSGFEILHHYYRPEGRPRAEQPWLAVVSRRGKIKS